MDFITCFTQISFLQCFAHYHTASAPKIVPDLDLWGEFAYFTNLAFLPVLAKCIYFVCKQIMYLFWSAFIYMLMIYGQCSSVARVAFCPALLQPAALIEQSQAAEARWSMSCGLANVSIGGGGAGFCFVFVCFYYFLQLWLVIAFLYHFEIYSLFNSIFIFYDYVSLTHKRVLGNMFWVSFNSNHI